MSDRHLSLRHNQDTHLRAMPAEELAPLQTSRVPPSSNDALIRSTYREICLNISQLDDAISDLSRQRQASHNYRHTLGDLLSPVRHIPPELLGEVFQLCLPTNYLDKGAHQAVMLPSHVCRYWRNVALSTPRLWAKINIDASDENLESRTALVTTWFSRSGTSSLSLTLKGRNIRPILDAVLPYCHRWQQVYLWMPSEMFQFPQQARGNLQRLETVNIRTWDDIRSHSAQHIFESAPKLRKLSLGAGFTRHNLNIPWAQLTEFDAGCHASTECLEMLECMQNLHKFRVRLKFIDWWPMRHPCVLDLRLLTSLHMRGGDGIGTFFDNLYLPTLRDLVLDDVGHHWAQTQFISLLSRSSPHLQSFSFGYSSDCMTDDNLIQILQHMPSLVSLSLNFFDCNACFTGTFMGRLFARTLENGHVDCSFSKLKTISIQLPDEGMSLNMEAYTKMIISRWRLAHTVGSDSRPIERIRVVKIKSLDKECIDEVLEGLASLRGLISTVYVDVGGCIHPLPACLALS